MVRPHVDGTFYNYGANWRLFWYPPWVDGHYYTPTVWVDGMDSLSYSASIAWWWNQYKSLISAHLSIPSPVEMNLQVYYGPESDTGMAYVEVIAQQPITYTGLRLYLAIIENDLYGGGQPRHQVLRRYEPSYLGLSFTISEGDTFTHSEEFVISGSWDDENCKIVAFVQDSPTYDVLQAIQSPLIVPTPVTVTDLIATLAGDDVRLDWSPVTEDTYGDPLAVDYYNVYRNTLGFFDAGSDPFATTTDIFYLDDTGVVGDTGTHYYYWVTAVAGYKESEASGGVGEFDRYLDVE